MTDGTCYDNIAWGISSAIENTPTTKGNLIAYPNPTKDDINFIIHDDTPANKYDISIYDTSGNLVWSDNKKFINNELKIDVRSLEDGLYFYTLTNKTGKIYTGRIVVMK